MTARKERGEKKEKGDGFAQLPCLIPPFFLPPKSMPRIYGPSAAAVVTVHASEMGVIFRDTTGEEKKREPSAVTPRRRRSIFGKYPFLPFFLRSFLRLRSSAR